MTARKPRDPAKPRLWPVALPTAGVLTLAALAGHISSRGSALLAAVLFLVAVGAALPTGYLLGAVMQGHVDFQRRSGR
jgi:hypothetical protein